MKILLITYYWPPCGGPGVQRALKFARYLPDYNIIPYVITVDEKKASYPIIDDSLNNDILSSVQVFKTDTSEPFGIYSSLTKKKEIPHSGFANERKASLFKKFSRFIRGNFYIPDARKGWNKYAYAKALELIEKEKFDAIMTSSPPHSTQLIGLKLKGKTGLPWIADLRDPWTDIYYYKDMMHTVWAARKDANYERSVLENADDILVVSPDIKRTFLRKSSKINPGKIHVIPNGYDDQDFSGLAESKSDQFTITYTGSIALNYGIQNFIKVLAAITKQGLCKIRLRFVGNAGEDIRNLVTTEGIPENVEFVSYLPHKKSVEMLMQSTILLLAIPQIKHNEGILTGKLFEYLATRKPIICIGPKKGDAAEIIYNCNAGEVFDYSEVDLIKAHLMSLIEAWSNGERLDRMNNWHIQYSRKALTSQLADVLKNRISK